jgi:hypothetical protein
MLGRHGWSVASDAGFEHFSSERRCCCLGDSQKIRSIPCMSLLLLQEIDMVDDDVDVGIFSVVVVAILGK